MKKSDEKTNVMRLIEAAGAEYKSWSYAGSGAVSGRDVAKVLGQNPAKVFKTLVTRGKSGNIFVYIVPVLEELNLKKAAAAVGEKKIEMIKSKELLPLTGYIHGGCSPLGMKKQFETTIDESALFFDTIIFSAGKIGYQVEVRLEDLQRMIPLQIREII